MKKVLHIQSSPRYEASVSRKLGEKVVEKIIEKYADSEVLTKDLAVITPPHLEEKHIAAFFTPKAQRSAEQQALADYSDQAIAELKQADIVVIESPMYNFTVPSTLKSYLDHITRLGETFGYGEQGAVGLLTDKKVYIVSTSGFDYSVEPMLAFNHNVPYLTQSLGFIGMSNISTFVAEGLKLTKNPEERIAQTIEQMLID